MAWAKNGTPLTLGSAAQDLDITDLTAYKFNQFMIHIITDGSNTVQAECTFNNDTTTYAFRQSVNGGADGTSTSDASIDLWDTSVAQDQFDIMYVCAISGEEVLVMNWFIRHGGTGATNAPARMETVGKYDGTTQVTRIDIHDVDGTHYDTDSNISALGTD
ncbi:unnamed protein product [marine sediment metagenome]|uniref:Uncharacterized protein n=1 Tax=marine sediment metagenome TaxID=412755 RepID=X0YFE8_9ZZZZ